MIADDARKIVAHAKELRKNRVQAKVDSALEGCYKHIAEVARNCMTSTEITVTDVNAGMSGLEKEQCLEAFILILRGSGFAVQVLSNVVKVSWEEPK